jgi:uncharacterized protein (TIGR02453 family)
MPMATAAFPGFPPQTRTFLRDLGEHNEKAWFDAHRADYERWWLAPARAFVEAIGPELAALAPEVRAEPRVNGSIMRINRDVRFSADKRPYKDHLDLWFWEGPERRAAVSGIFCRLTPEIFAVGVGAHGIDPALLKRYRAAVVDPTTGSALADAVRTVESAGLEVLGERYSRPPAGFTADGDAARLLRHAGLWTVEEAPADAVAESPGIVEHALAHWRAALPLHRWLVDTLQR